MHTSLKSEPRTTNSLLPLKTRATHSGLETQPMAHDRPSELELEHVVSEGSFGKIFRARYKATSAIVAVKVVSESDEVRNEIRMLSKCCSAFVVGYFGSFACGPDMWVVTDYCGGGFLSDLIHSDGSIPIECIRAVCAGIALGLEYLHGVNIYHRDIRCYNVLLSNAGYIKLTGFGLSCEASDEVGRKRKSVVDSTYWMAPEVIKGDYYDGKADVWSLGIATIEMAEGTPPHSSLDPLSAKLAIPSNPPPTLADPDGWGPEIVEFIDCCCRMDPTERGDSESLTSHQFVQHAVSRGRLGSPLFPWRLIRSNYI